MSSWSAVPNWPVRSECVDRTGIFEMKDCTMVALQLSKRTEECLEIIQAESLLGKTPTQTEIATRMGISQPKVLDDALLKLIAQGLVERTRAATPPSRSRFVYRLTEKSPSKDTPHG